MNTELGKITREQDGFKVVFDRTLNHSIERVWDAITNPEKLKVWFTDFEMKLESGSKIKIIFRDEHKTVTNGEILEVSPPNRFVWTWEGELAVWELTKLGENKCRLLFTYSKLSDQYAVGASGGFHTLMDRLELVLNGRQESWPFGTEEFDPVQIQLRETYGQSLYDEFPDLEKHNPIVMQREFDVPVARLWEALTKNEQLKDWYFDFRGNFKAEVGHVFEWSAGPSPEEQWLHRGKILEVILNEKLVHSWEYPGYKGLGTLIWKLTRVSDSKSILTLRFEFTEGFDTTVDALRRKNFLAGWTEIVNGSLVEFLK